MKTIILMAALLLLMAIFVASAFGTDKTAGPNIPAVVPKTLRPGEIQWEPHPRFNGLESAFLLTHKDDGADLTCMLTRLNIGVEVPEHIHEFDEIIYVVQGRAMIHIDGSGDRPMVPGAFLRIPAGVKHRPFNVEEDILAYNVFYPFMK